MRVNGNAAAIVADGQPVANAKIDLDTACMAGHSLIHRVVEHFRCKMMQRAFVDTANVHAGAAADRLKPLQHLNRRSGIIIGCGGCGCAPAKQVIIHNFAIGAGESPAQARAQSFGNSLWIFRFRLSGRAVRQMASAAEDGGHRGEAVPDRRGRNVRRNTENRG